MQDNTYPHWEKGAINWRLYVQPGMFGAAETREVAYEQTKRVIDFHRLYISLPPLEDITSVGVEQNEIT
jgi:hypothetical protein